MISSKKWMLIICGVLVINMSLVAIVNYVVDPFNVFQSNILEKKIQMNERFVKIDYLDENHKKYNAYLFGSSRIGVIEPKVFEQYIPKSKFYNFTVSSSNLHDYLMHLEYLVKEKYEIKELILQLDIDNMYYYGQGNSDYLSLLHPYVVDESLILFYAKYLFGFFPLNLKAKIEVNLGQVLQKSYDLETGVWRLEKKEKRLLLDAKKYVQEEKSFHIKNRRIISNIQEKENKKSLKKIVDLCKAEGINLYVLTTPHNQNMMDTFIIKDYKKYLRNISEITGFYDFSGYNSITKNNANYYEISHYRPLVAEFIAAKIFNDKNIEVPNDFGKFIEKGSLLGQ